MAKKTQATANSKDNARDRSAGEALLDEFFNDYYKHSGKIYRLNFVRGIFFGFGSVLGGTVVVAILVYAMSYFVDYPLIGQFFERLLNALEQQ